ncbi:diguanylate cyclase [Candidatus Desantisbacteria bacterium]|nr:diguanylate cyclase [Candidatus Desantisbacteria bacterium]
MIKKNVSIVIITLSVLISILSGFIIYTQCENLIANNIYNKNQKILKSIMSQILKIKNSYNVDNIPKEKLNNYIKNCNLLYVMILDGDLEITSSNKNEYIGSPYRNDFTEEIFGSKKIIQRELHQTKDGIFEIGQSLRLENFAGIMLIGISMKEYKSYKTILLISTITFSIMLIISGVLLTVKLNDRITSPFNNLENLCLNIINNKNIPEKLQYELHKAFRYKRPLSCLIVDIENMEYLSSHSGVQKADTVLKEISNIFKSDLRKVDLVGRHGKSSFLIVLPEIQELQSRIVAEKLFKKLLNYKVPDENEKIPLLVVIGINSYITSKTEIDENIFISQLEKTVQDAKLEGKNKITTAV